MAKILAFGVKAEELEKIKKAAGGLRLRVESVPAFLYRQNIAVLSGKKIESLIETLQMAPETELYQGEAPQKSMLVFCDLEDKRMDKLLAALKKNQVQVDYKAMQTMTNSTWNVLRLYAEMERERRAWSGV